MNIKPILIAATSLAAGVLTSQATVLGGIDPAAAPGVFSSDGAGNLMVISNQFTHTTTSAESIDLSLSTFSYQSNANAGAGATPFLAVQSGANSHLTGDYDVIWVGMNLSNANSGVDVSGSLGFGTLSLPASSTIVGGFFSSGANGLSPVSAVFGGGSADDILIIAQGSASIADDIAVTGTDWSPNGAVTNRTYHYQMDLQAVPEPGAGLLLLFTCVPVLLRRRR